MKEKGSNMFHIYFDKKEYFFKYEKKEWSSRRIAAAKRALKKEKEKAGLFGEELMNFRSIDERISQIDKAKFESIQKFRDYEARTIRELRKDFRALSYEDKKDVIEYWNKSHIPKVPFRFASLLNNLKIDPLYFKRLKGEAHPYTRTVIRKGGKIEVIEISKEESIAGIYKIDTKKGIS